MMERPVSNPKKASEEAEFTLGEKILRIFCCCCFKPPSTRPLDNIQLMNFGFSQVEPGHFVMPSINSQKSLNVQKGSGSIVEENTINTPRRSDSERSSFISAGSISILSFAKDTSQETIISDASTRMESQFVSTSTSLEQLKDPAEELH
jgi:hypothetical protein